MNFTKKQIYRKAYEKGIDVDNMPINDVYNIVVDMCKNGYIIDVIEFLGLHLTVSELLLFSNINKDNAHLVLADWLLIEHGMRLKVEISIALQHLNTFEFY